MLGRDLIDREEIVSELEVAAKVMRRLGAGGRGMEAWHRCVLILFSKRSNARKWIAFTHGGWVG